MFFVRFLRQWISWLKEIRYEEKIALLRITLIFTVCSYLICLLYVSIPANEWLWGRAVTVFFQCLIAVSVPAGLAVWLGNALPSLWFRKSLEKGVAASPLLSKLGFHSAEAALHFARQFKLSVYSVSDELRTDTAKDVACRLEPLFLAPGYPSSLRDEYYKKNLLWFDEKEVELVLDRIARGAITLTPDRIRSIVDQTKDEVIKEKEKAIETLQEEVESLKEKVSNKNRGDGPYRATARARLFQIFELYAALIGSGVLLKRWFKNKGKGYKKEEIHKEFRSILAQHEDLKTLLQKIKPDAKLEGVQEDTLVLLRTAMPEEMVEWSGQEKPTWLSITKEILTKCEMADLFLK